nr:protein kinase-like domain, phloem protein 2-like protein [Tanacetum cinerariifolium]
HGQGDGEFYKEVRMLSCYKHENIISLLGFSSGRDEMILVYEYASRGSLDGHLKDVNLTWTQRLKVCLDAAKGLCYLHDPRNTYQRLIHCDIKSANILLDENFKAKEDHDTIGNLPKKYDQIIKAAGDPLNYTSLEELKALLSKGVLLNGGKT